MEFFDVRSIIGGALLLACLGCVPQRELSSYNEGATSGLDQAHDQAVADSAMSGPGASPGAAPPAAGDVETVPDAMPAAAIEEANPSGAPLDPASMNAADSEPAGSDSAGSDSTGSDPAARIPAAGDDPPTAPPPEIDASISCAAMGGFTIAPTESCYMLGDEVFAWQDARNFCQAWGGDLVEIGSFDENEALARSIDGSVWIGATDQEQEGVFRWAGGAPLVYAGWSFNQPNNLQGDEDCAELRSWDQGWSDVPCTDDFARRALCERE